MGGIAGKKNPPVLIALGDHAVSGPGTDGEKLEGNAISQREADLGGRVENIELLLIDVAHVQTP